MSAEDEPIAPLSFEEKYQLTLDLSKLPESDLAEIRDLISKELGRTVSEIDVDSLDDKTLRKIQQYIRTTFIEYSGLQFIITNSPKDYNLDYYVDLYKQNNVKDVVRTCHEGSYDASLVEKHGITIHNWNYEDGALPPEDVINKWLELIERSKITKKQKSEGIIRRTIAVHCAAGLGRAPVLVAIALIEGGMDNLAVIDLIRGQRPGAINRKQLKFIQEYKPRSKGTNIFGKLKRALF
eukprot:Colp12_sorted_trinity150504_noHs@23478